MHTSAFFKLFPPPKFLLMPHAGLDISDDAVRFIEYSGRIGNRTILKYGRQDLPEGMIESGDVKDEKAFGDALAKLSREHGVSYAKISIPEEKAYLFETEVPYGDPQAISQNIEFKLEENIPLSAPDAVFAFDLLPIQKGMPWRASVSAVPRSYIERMIRLFHRAGIMPVSFEIVPRAIARVVSEGFSGATVVVHVMSHKTGVYVASDSAVAFTSTIGVGSANREPEAYTKALSAEIEQVYAYWLSRSDGVGIPIERVIVVGTDAERVVIALKGVVTNTVPIEVADIWHSVLDVAHYVPPITRAESLGYAPAAGLAL